jgi:hypothetical protein
MYRMDAPDGREPTRIVFATLGRLPCAPFADAVAKVQDQMNRIPGLLVVRFGFFILNSRGNSLHKSFFVVHWEKFLKGLILTSRSSSLGECSFGVVHRRHTSGSFCRLRKTFVLELSELHVPSTRTFAFQLSNFNTSEDRPARRAEHEVRLLQLWTAAPQLGPRQISREPAVSQCTYGLPFAEGLLDSLIPPCQPLRKSTELC